MESNCLFFFFSSRRRHTRWPRDWSSDVCSSDLLDPGTGPSAGCSLGVAVPPQVVVEGVKDPSVDRVKALAPQGRLDLLRDQAAVVLHRVRRDGLVARGAP